MSKLVFGNCGYENKGTMKFCINCGTRLEKEVVPVENEKTENRFCEGCGHEIEPEQAFCENCGNKILKEERQQEEMDEVATKEFKQEGIDSSMAGTYITRENKSVLISSVPPSNRRITYKEKTGESNTYYFYRWSSWGPWQDNHISSNDNTQVETRTMYRYRAK